MIARIFFSLSVAIHTLGSLAPEQACHEDKQNTLVSHVSWGGGGSHAALLLLGALYGLCQIDFLLQFQKTNEMV